MKYDPVHGTTRDAGDTGGTGDTTGDTAGGTSKIIFDQEAVGTLLDGTEKVENESLVEIRDEILSENSRSGEVGTVGTVGTVDRIGYIGKITPNDVNDANDAKTLEYGEKLEQNPHSLDSPMAKGEISVNGDGSIVTGQPAIDPIDPVHPTEPASESKSNNFPVSSDAHHLESSNIESSKSVTQPTMLNDTSLLQPGQQTPSQQNVQQNPLKKLKLTIRPLKEPILSGESSQGTRESSPLILTDLPFDTSEVLSRLPFETATTSLNVSKGIKHLKKKDGEPFWRKDIQFEFLHHLFSDDQRVFTNYFSWCEIPNATNSVKLTFAELYLRTMAESLKLSKVLRERLIKDPEMGINVSKVCFLVNAGRINTTVNFLPDMRSAFRTFHSLPSLQSDHNGPRKPLQDTPRLKSILKAVCDGQEHLQTLLDVLRSPAPSKPNTNVIKLIFLMSSFFQNVPFHYDDPSIEGISLEDRLKVTATATGPQNKFMEFFLDDDICPKNRAQRFLWLMFTYLETSFTSEELDNNPFHPKVIPPVEYLSEAQIKDCDVDSPEEIAYAAKMFQTRMSYLDEEVGPTGRGAKVTREKNSLKRQYPGGHLAKINIDTVDEELANRLVDKLADEPTLNDDPVTADESMIADENDRPNCVQRIIPDRSKRKKPTPSVGSLIESSKKSVVLEGKWKTPQFPILNLDIIKKRLLPPEQAPFLKDLTSGTALSLAKRKYVALKTQLPMAQLLSLIPDYDEKRDKMLAELYRLFHYKKASKTGLLGMEWEDLRTDLVNGVETYLYQQLGKDLLTRQFNEVVEEDKSYGVEVEHIRKEVYPASTELHVGDLAPVHYSNLDKLGEGYLPEHDYNRFNERLAHDYVIIGILSSVLKKSVLLKTVGSEGCSFDLENETLLFAF